MNFCNMRIRLEACGKKVKLCELASALGYSPQSFSRMMRTELPEDQTEKLLDLIDQIAESGADA